MRHIVKMFSIHDNITAFCDIFEILQSKSAGGILQHPK